MAGVNPPTEISMHTLGAAQVCATWSLVCATCFAAVAVASKCWKRGTPPAVYGDQMMHSNRADDNTTTIYTHYRLVPEEP